MTPDPYAALERQAIQDVEREEEREHRIAQFKAAIKDDPDA